MGHICFLDRRKLEYDGLCSHVSLNEGIRGQFDMSAEELEVYAKEREKKRKMVHNEGNSNWHYKKMAEDYDDYIGRCCERVMRSRANNPERQQKSNAARARAALENHSFDCDLCNK